MALSLEKTQIKKSKERSQDDSLLDVILKHKERRSRLKQKGEIKSVVTRPWENESTSRSEGKDVVMKSFEKTKPKSKKQKEDAKLKSRVSDRASRIFDDLDF